MAWHMPLLRRLAAASRFIVELGAGNGNGSTRAFSDGLHLSPADPKLFVSVDIEDRPAFEKPEIYYWTKVTGNSQDPTVAALVAGIGTAQVGTPNPDIIFLDTIHTYEFTAPELAVWTKLNGPGTLWLFHDTHPGGCYSHMNDAISEHCQRNPEWEWVDYTEASWGLGVMVNKDKQVSAKWREILGIE